MFRFESHVQDILYMPKTFQSLDEKKKISTGSEHLDKEYSICNTYLVRSYEVHLFPLLVFKK